MKAYCCLLVGGPLFAIVVVVALLSINSPLGAHATNWCSGGVCEEWVARYNDPANGWDQAHALAVDGSGNVYVTGYSEHNGPDYATIKYGGDGNQQWAARYDGPASGNDAANALAVDGSGNVYVTGYSRGSVTLNDYATVKYDAGGAQQWVARYDGPANYQDWATALAVDGSGNVYVTGYSTGSGMYEDYATIKYDGDGNEQWVARYNGAAGNHDEANALAVDATGNVYVTGRSRGSGTKYDYATVKYNAGGAQQWVARYDGPANDEEWATALAVDGSGNVYVTGMSGGSGTDADYATIKYDGDGNEQWVARYDGPASQGDWANDVAVDGSGNVYVTGYSGGSGADYATIKYDGDGNQQWVARYDGPVSQNDLANALAVDGSGNVYVTGYSGGSGTDYDYATIKYDGDGDQLWLARYDGGGAEDFANALSLGGSGNVYVTGASRGDGRDYATIKYSQPATITVDSTTDSNSRDGVLTLREAMMLATGTLAVGDLDAGEADNVSGTPGAASDDTIVFDTVVFPPVTPATITLGSTLPMLSTANDTVDGSAAGVIVDGVAEAFECFRITSNGNTIKGLELITNCFSGVVIDNGGQDNVVGGATPQERNVISGNLDGVVISGGSGNMVKGNYIGTDMSGMAALPNDWGVVVGGGTGNTVGGSTPGEGNVISGNGSYPSGGGGVVMTEGGPNLVKGNYIGVDASGVGPLGNRWGVYVYGAGHMIGGSAPGERNIISGNWDGLQLEGDGTIVMGNYIGTDASGTIALGSVEDVRIWGDGNVIGGSAPGEGNVICGAWHGILVSGQSTGNTIRGNYIGTNTAGASGLGNGVGILIESYYAAATGHVIGGPVTGEGNVVAFNGEGIRVAGSFVTGNTIRGNSIHSNDGKGIENVDGGNAELPPPVIAGLGSVDGTACANCTVDIYSDSEDEGRIYEGSVEAGPSGDFSWAGTPMGPNVTATATDAEGNTSEFSTRACLGDVDCDGVPDAADNCPLVVNPSQVDSDSDGQGDACDVCTNDSNDDADNDGICVGNGYQPPKTGDNDNCPNNPNPLQEDYDADTLGDACDPDDDNDTVLDGDDTDPLDEFVCRDLDSDTCDDCSVLGQPDVSDDGPDNESDGLCDAGDPDDDNDTVLDGNDADPLDTYVCEDLDTDTCDDCSVLGQPDVSDDGPDNESDGLCDVGDPDDDNDALPDAWEDSFACTDKWTSDATDDDDTDSLTHVQEYAAGTDPCDPDTDNDTVPEGDDVDPLDAYVCRDVDSDTCDDCSVLGQPNTSNDGADTDSDGACNAGDVCTSDPNDDADSDGICVGSGYLPPKTGDNDNCPTAGNEDQLNSDTDSHGDACDNCPLTDNEAQANTDADLEDAGASVIGDGQGDACDPDDDNDGWVDIEGPVGGKADETYLATAVLDNCSNSPPGPGGDAWPLDTNMDTVITVVGDVLNYSGRIGASAGPPPSANWWGRLDLNMDNVLTVVGDVLKFSGNIGRTCT